MKAMNNERLLWRLSGWFLMAAMFLGFGGGTLRAEDDIYELVTDASTLKHGDKVLLVTNSTAPMAMTASFSSAGNRQGLSVKDYLANNVITNPDIATIANDKKPCVFTLEKNAEGNYAFNDKLNTEKYIAINATSSANNPLPSVADPYYFIVTIANNGEATISNPAKTADVRFNGFSDFRAYQTSSSSGVKVGLFRKKVETPPDPVTPYIQTEQTEVSYTIQPTKNLHENLFFRAGNLEDGVTVSVASADAGRTDAVISVDPEDISKEDANAAPIELTLTTSNLSIGEYKDIITLASGDATVEVTVNLLVKNPDIYRLVTNAARLKADDEVLIVGEGGYAMTASGVADDAREAVQVTIADNAITDPIIATKANEKKACVFTLEKDADGNYAFNDNLNTKKYLTSAGGSNVPSSTTPSYFSVDIDASTGVAVVKPVGASKWIRYYAGDDFKLTSSTSTSYKNVYLYKKQVADEPTCDPVTLTSDGAVTPGEDDVTITWDAPAAGAPANGYRVTVKGNGYTKSETVANTETQIDWAAELSSETEYSFEIVSLCGEDNESDPVTGKFTTLHIANPEIKITSPVNNAVFTDDVTFVFTTEDFDLDETHLVRAEVKTKAQDSAAQAAAPVLKRVYTQSSPLTISGLADGKYHVDLYMVEVTPKTEGTGNDTTVVGFDGNYVHRDIEVKSPAVSFSAQNLKITTYRGTAASGKVMVTGWGLPENATVTLTSDNDKFTVAPATLPQAQVTATGGAEITVTYNGTDATANAAITATCGNLTATLAVNAIARDTLANLKGIYSRVANDTVLVRGKMVVTHKDSSANSRVWVQDIDRENGASMVLYNVTAARGYAALKVGDVLENVAGRVTISNGLYRFTPLANLAAVEQGHAVYVDTMSLTAVRANSSKAEAQSALVCIKDVRFRETGTFNSTQNFTLLQGKDTLVFRGYAKADYIGQAIPTTRLYVTAIVGYDNGARVSARSQADMVNAPCPLPTEVSVDAHSNEAELDWEGWPENYSVRYGTTQDLSGVTPVAVATSHLKIENLVTETQYYYQIKSVCGTGGYESAWTVVEDFTTLSAHAPTIAMLSPVNKPVFTDSVKVSFRITNVTLKAGDTVARIVFSDGITVDNYTDTVYKRAMPSGDYSVQVILVKDGQPLTPGVQTNVRYFSVDLPDVARPVFTPAAGRYVDSVEVTLSCATQGSKIFYARDEGDYVAYTAGSKIVLKESATLKAYAAKERMDTSAVASARYVITKTIATEGDLVFEEPFDKITVESDGASNIAGNLDNYTHNPGWSGDNVYQGAGGRAKLGTNSKLGYLQTPALDLSANDGKFMLSFDAQAYNNSREKDSIILVVNDVAKTINGLPKDGMSNFVFTFTSGTEATTIRFSAAEDGYNRFYLDNVRIYQVLPDVPRLMVSPAMFEMNTDMGTPVSRTVSVKGNLLSEDVTVTLLQTNENFSVSATTLAAADVMGEDGAELTVTFNASVAEDSVKMELVSGGLSQTVMVRAYATGGHVDECVAPTQLNAAVADKSVTLTWNGAADKYRVVVLKLGEQEVCNEFVTEKTYTLSDLGVGAYAWMVASVCEEGEQWANGENFEVKAVLANDDAEELSFRIYPNPTAGVFYVEVTEGARMEIFTLGGATVRNEILKAGKNEIRLDRSGIYFVRLTNATGSAVQRVIVL